MSIHVFADVEIFIWHLELVPPAVYVIMRVSKSAGCEPGSKNLSGSRKSAELTTCSILFEVRPHLHVSPNCLSQTSMNKKYVHLTVLEKSQAQIFSVQVSRIKHV